MGDQSQIGVLDHTLRSAPKRTILQALAWGLAVAVLAWAWNGRGDPSPGLD